MNRISSLSPLIAFSLILAGCGGNASLNVPNLDVARFAGSYTGTFTAAPSSGIGTDNGTLNVVVAPDGTITGTTTDSRYGGLRGDVSNSRVQADGSVTFTTIYPSGGEFPFTKTSTGVLSRDGNVISGTLQEDNGSFTTPFNYTLNRVSGG